MDRHDRGKVTFFGLKKCGSSQLNKAIGETRWESTRFGWEDRYVAFMRHPCARLWSCWHHLVRPRTNGNSHANDRSHQRRDHNFGPAVPFKDWLGWVFTKDPADHDPHIRPQSLELYDGLESTTEDATIFIGTLETCREEMPRLCRWLTYQMRFEPPKKPPIPHWAFQYTNAQVRMVREYFHGDMALWVSVWMQGSVIVNCRSLRRQIKP